MASGKISELELVKRIAKKVRNDSSVVRGIGDDAAVLRYTKNTYLLFTSDMLIEGIDFDSKAHPQEIGHKALACSLSDIAAMGGIPKYALISIGVPYKNPVKFIDGFYKGVLRLSGQFKTNIVGGDLSFSKEIVIDVAMIGEVDKKRLTLRSGARPQDIIFVSGPLGGSLYGRHLKFMPRLKEAKYLVSNYKINSMMDISDGLSLDLHRLCQASNVGAVIYENLIPVSPDAKSPDEALTMGEDFELLFVMPLDEARRMSKNCGKTFVPLERGEGKTPPARFKAIGEIREKSCGVKIVTKNLIEKVLEPKGYQHF